VYAIFSHIDRLRLTSHFNSEPLYSLVFPFLTASSVRATSSTVSHAPKLRQFSSQSKRVCPICIQSIPSVALLNVNHQKSSQSSEKWTKQKAGSILSRPWMSSFQNDPRNCFRSCQTVSSPKLSYIYASGTWVHNDNCTEIVIDTLPCTNPANLDTWHVDQDQGVVNSPEWHRHPPWADLDRSQHD
jgi:hypothetical protein